MDRLLPVERAAKMLRAHPKTLRHWDEHGKVRVVRTPGGKRRIPESEIRRLRGEAPLATRAVYGRVASRDQKARGDPQRQVAHVRAAMEQAVEPPFAEVMPIIDVASGLSERRTGPLRLMSPARGGRITDLASTCKDRLTRLGFGYLEQSFAGYGVGIHVVDGGDDTKSLQEELVDDDPHRHQLLRKALRTAPSSQGERSGCEGEGGGGG